MKCSYVRKKQVLYVICVEFEKKCDLFDVNIRRFA